MNNRNDIIDVDTVQSTAVARADSLKTWGWVSYILHLIVAVLWAGVLYLVTAPLWLFFLLPGWIAWGLISIWFLYRIVKGMVRMNAGKPITP